MPARQAAQKWLTSQEKEALYAASAFLINAFFDEYHKADAWQPETVFLTRLGEHLPRPYFARYTPLFYKEFGTCIVVVAWKLAQPKRMALSSIMEELAAWAIMTAAKQQIELDDEEEGETGGEQAAGYAFEDLIEVFFEDEDFLLLFDESNEGIETSPRWPVAAHDLARVQRLDKALYR